jgi:hypothetical protein
MNFLKAGKADQAEEEHDLETKPPNLPSLLSTVDRRRLSEASRGQNLDRMLRKLSVGGDESGQIRRTSIVTDAITQEQQRAAAIGVTVETSGAKVLTIEDLSLPDNHQKRRASVMQLDDDNESDTSIVSMSRDLSTPSTWPMELVEKLADCLFEDNAEMMVHAQKREEQGMDVDHYLGTMGGGGAEQGKPSKQELKAAAAGAAAADGTSSDAKEMGKGDGSGIPPNPFRGEDGPNEPDVFKLGHLLMLKEASKGRVFHMLCRAYMACSTKTQICINPKGEKMAAMLEKAAAKSAEPEDVPDSTTTKPGGGKALARQRAQRNRAMLEKQAKEAAEETEQWLLRDAQKAVVRLFELFDSFGVGTVNTSEVISTLALLSTGNGATITRKVGVMVALANVSNTHPSHAYDPALGRNEVSHLLSTMVNGITRLLIFGSEAPPTPQSLEAAQRTHATPHYASVAACALASIGFKEEVVEPVHAVVDKLKAKMVGGVTYRDSTDINIIGVPGIDVPGNLAAKRRPSIQGGKNGEITPAGSGAQARRASAGLLKAGPMDVGTNPTVHYAVGEIEESITSTQLVVWMQKLAHAVQISKVSTVDYSVSTIRLSPADQGLAELGIPFYTKVYAPKKRENTVPKHGSSVDDWALAEMHRRKSAFPVLMRQQLIKAAAVVGYDRSLHMLPIDELRKQEKEARQVEENNMKAALERAKEIAGMADAEVDEMDHLRNVTRKNLIQSNKDELRAAQVRRVCVDVSLIYLLLTLNQ